MRSNSSILFGLIISVTTPWAYAVDASGETPAAKAEQAPRFDLWEFAIEGNSLLDTKLIERTVYPYLGPDRSLSDIEAARMALETFYRDSGYPTVVVNTPEQTVKQGVVRLEVIEGRISRVRVSGSRYFSLDQLRKEVPALTAGEVPHLPALQTQIAQVNSVTPDRRVTPVFRPGRTPGTVVVDLKVKDELPLHGDIEVNGRNSEDTTRTRTSTTLRYSNLFQKAHSASLMLMTAPENTDDVKVAALTYVVPREGSNDVMAGYAVVTRSDVATAGAITVLGDGTIVGARYIHPLAALRRFSHNITLGLDYKDFDESLLPGGSETVNTPIDYVSLMGAYRGNWLHEDGHSTLGAGVHFGVRGLGNTEKEFEEKRFKARPNYIYATAFLEHEQSLPGRFSLFGKLDGQLADSPLVSNEQYSAGGAESVRGYFESQALGDHAVHGMFELRSPSLAAYVSRHLNKLNLFMFLDGAKLYIKDALPGQSTAIELYGAGAGLRLRGPAGFEADLALAWPLKDNGKAERGELRPHFRLHYGF